LEFGVLVFVEGGKLENPEKPLGARRESTTLTNSTHIWHWARIQNRPYWREASTLPTASSLLPLIKARKIRKSKQ